VFGVAWGEQLETSEENRLSFLLWVGLALALGDVNLLTSALSKVCGIWEGSLDSQDKTSVPAHNLVWKSGRDASASCRRFSESRLQSLQP
jgi:hypothetical protein